ncbi:hypothetical protein WK03_16955 [Burkholderia cepacia]|nr:hypothetical protein WK03_16955 [Burkholderia cepacia]
MVLLVRYCCPERTDQLLRAVQLGKRPINITVCFIDQGAGLMPERLDLLVAPSKLLGQLMNLCVALDGGGVQPPDFLFEAPCIPQEGSGVFKVAASFIDDCVNLLSVVIHR